RDRALPAGWSPADPIATAAQQQQSHYVAQSMHLLRQQGGLDIVPEDFEGSFMTNNARQYGNSIVICQPGDGQGGVEGSGDMYNQDDGTDARDYPHQQQHVFGNSNFYHDL
ncbi:hypothetical protein V492_02289, partial [Pseudogymnoascus sp. VKM F-4246]